jgi:hypothetical protein
VYRYLNCRLAWKDREECPLPSAQRADKVESFVEKMFLRLAGGIEVAEPEYVPGSNTAAERARLEDVHRWLMTEIMTKGPEIAKRYETQLETVESQLEDLGPDTPATTVWRPTGVTYDQRWKEASDAEKNELLRKGGFRFGIVNLEAVDGSDARGLLEQGRQDDESIEIGWAETFGIALYYPTDFEERLNG